MVKNTQTLRAHHFSPAQPSAVILVMFSSFSLFFSPAISGNNNDMVEAQLACDWVARRALEFLASQMRSYNCTEHALL